jgi:hypothetical protein
MATYGFVSYRSDGTSVILQNSSKSGVFARRLVLTRDIGTPIPYSESYRIEFPEYNGRNLQIFQLKSGDANWTYGKLSTGLNVIDYTFVVAPEIYGVTFPDRSFSFDRTVLYIFIK